MRDTGIFDYTQSTLFELITNVRTIAQFVRMPDTNPQNVELVTCELPNDLAVSLPMVGVISRPIPSVFGAAELLTNASEPMRDGELNLVIARVDEKLLMPFGK